MQLCCSKMIMTSKPPLLNLIIAAGGPARELHDRRHLNLKECSTFKGIQTKGRLTMVMTSLSTFSGLLEVLIGQRNLARWALYILYYCYTHSFPSAPWQAWCCIECRGMNFNILFLDITDNFLVAPYNSSRTPNGSEIEIESKFSCDRR